MAFVHGKRANVLLRDANNKWNDMSPYLNEVTFPGKAGIAETTVFGRGAKTYIGGLLEGQLTMKGFFDPSSTSVSISSGSANPQAPDATLSGLLGTQATTGLTVVAQVSVQSNYGQVIVCPSGFATGEALIADVVMTDLSIQAPVTGVVAFTATFNLSGAPNLPLQGTSGTVTSTNLTGVYGLQIIRAATSAVFSTSWITNSAGVVLTSIVSSTV